MTTESTRIPERLVAQPGGEVSGAIRVPGDKSISHRAVMFSALADGESVIRKCLLGEDVLATIAAFQSMGVAITKLGKAISKFKEWVSMG